MTEELINKMVEEYAKNIVSSYKVVAKKAYLDGLLDAMKYMREKLSEL